MISLTGPKHAGMFSLCSHLLLRRKYSSIIIVQWSRKINFIGEGGGGQNTRHWTRAWSCHMHIHAMNVWYHIIIVTSP